MKAKHTPGPWTLGKYNSGNDNCGEIVSDNPHGEGAECVASVKWVRGDFHEEQVANAWLISAAPELLSALKNILAAYRESISGTEVDQARNAIAKALGK